MSELGWLVIRAIDQAEQTYTRHPTLFAAQLRNDRDCRQLARAVDRYKRETPRTGRRPLIDQVERIDEAWEEREARRREDRFSKRKRVIDSERRSTRAVMTAFELHRSAIERQAKISTVAAGNVEPSRSTSTGAGPPNQQQLDDDPRWQEHWSVIRSRLERIHELLDEAEGLSAVASLTTMTGVEKDRLIVDAANRGLRAQAVVDKLGSDIAGSAETVRRIRRRMGYDHLGHELQLDQ